MNPVKVSAFIVLLFMVALFAFKPKGTLPKTYPVSLTTDQWQSRLQTINAAKEIMRKSTLPGNVISQYSDSLDVMAKEISEQVGSQLQSEAAKAKTDSTSKPKK